MIVTERNSDQVAAAIFEINKYEYYVDQTQLNRTKFDWTQYVNEC
jgi:hypothetical protein